MAKKGLVVDTTKEAFKTPKKEQPWKELGLKEEEYNHIKTIFVGPLTVVFGSQSTLTFHPIRLRIDECAVHIEENGEISFATKHYVQSLISRYELEF